VRICAEDPASGFLPQTGRIELLRTPNAPGVRLDHALYEGMEVTPDYDPMLAKLLVWHATRTGAIERLLCALRELRILGVPTNIGFLQDVIAHPAFRSGELHTGFVSEHMSDWQAAQMDDVAGQVAQTLLSAPPSRQTGVSAPPTVWTSLAGWSNT
jgi:acetyl/propionyl-CoA carboxylase alpha subunit